jgi:membrane protease YdiL (CAAX protease family)
MFFEAARQGDNTFFKYAITLISVMVGAIVAQIPLAVVVGERMREQALMTGAASDIYALGLDDNLLLALILLSFAGAFLGLYVGVRYFHFKRFTAIFTGRRQLDWGRVGFGFLLWIGLTAGFELISYSLLPEAYSLSFEPKQFGILLLIALTLLPIQTTVEEAVFRGYLMQGLGLATHSRWIALVLTSVLFGALHFANLEVTEFGLGVMMVYYISIGGVLGLVTLMDEGTELAIGLHAATNMYSATIVGYAGASMQTPALFRIDQLNAPLMLAVSLVASGLFIWIAARKYGWQDWGKLWRRIPQQTDDTQEDFESTITNQ